MLHSIYFKVQPGFQILLNLRIYDIFGVIVGTIGISLLLVFSGSVI